MSQLVNYGLVLIIIFLAFSVYDNYIGVEDSNENDASIIQRIITSSPERKAESQEVFDYLNELRAEKKLSVMGWDDRAYNMAISRSKDMFQRDYFSHKTPEGECMLTLKDDFGFSNQEIVAENLGGLIHYANGEPTYDATLYDTLEQWIGSQGHNENLFYSEHIKGAIGCYESICVFNGVHKDLYGLGAAPCSMYD
jgi:uncharacterized protein YkwD